MKDDQKLQRALDRLFEAPPKEFTRVRQEIARGFKSEGDDALAKQVTGIKRPTRAAWAINRIALHHEKVLKGVFDAYDAASTHPGKAGARDASQLKRALADYRESLAKVAHFVKDELASIESSADPALLREITQMIQAAALDDAERDRMLAGRVERFAEEEDDDGAGGALPKVPHPPKSTRRLTRKREASDGEREASEKKREAADRKHAAEERKREAAADNRDAAERKRAEAERKREAVEARRREEAEKKRAARERAEIERKLTAAKRRVHLAESRAARAKEALDTARETAEAATAELAAARDAVARLTKTLA